MEWFEEEKTPNKVLETMCNKVLYTKTRIVFTRGHTICRGETIFEQKKKKMNPPLPPPPQKKKKKSALKRTKM